MLGDTHSAHDLSPNELLVLGNCLSFFFFFFCAASVRGLLSSFRAGRHGLLLVGKGSQRHVPIIVAHISLMARSIFISNFYMRLFSLGETLKDIRKLIEEHEKVRIVGWIDR